jgi:hypothetical protein
MINICTSDIFIDIKKEDERKKFKLNHNIYARYSNKKVGNLLFNFSYCSSDIYPNEIENFKQKAYYDLSVKYFYYQINRKLKLSTNLRKITS